MASAATLVILCLCISNSLSNVLPKFKSPPSKNSIQFPGDGMSKLENAKIPLDVDIAEPPVVQTLYGAAQGYRGFDRLNRTYDAFIGIPFAKPPVGPLRWQPPEVPEPWDGVRNATEFSDHCIHVISRAWFFLGMGGKDSEDCLYLNIYVPGSTEQTLSDPLPVMVFYHGGAFVLGTAEGYPGEELAVTGEVIVVTANYRLSTMGFFSTGDSVAPGNYAIWDGKASVEWVVANIGFFGGDPDRVTVFGQSAGGSLVSLMMLSPLVNDIFQGAIPISGSAYAKLSDRRSADHLARHFNCSTENTTALVNCLMMQDAKELDDTFYTQYGNDTSHYDWDPVIDGIIIPQDPHDGWKQGIGSHINFMTGYTYHDSAGFLIGNPIALPLNRSSDEWNKNNDELYEGWQDYFSYSDNSEQIIQTLYERYPDMNHSDPAVATESVSRVRTDMGFASHAYEQAQYHASAEGEGSTYFYEFSHRQSFLEAYPAWVNGSHLDDVYSILGEPYFEFYRDVYLRGAEYSPEDSKLAEVIMKYYGNFAHTGDPSTGLHDVDVEWPQFDTGSKQYMLETPTPLVMAISPEKVEEYNWFLYNLTSMLSTPAAQVLPQAFSNGWAPDWLHDYEEDILGNDHHKESGS